MIVLDRACYLCHRTDPIRYGTFVRVAWPDGFVRDVCDDCWSKNEGHDEVLDMEEGDDAEG